MMRWHFRTLNLDKMAVRNGARNARDKKAKRPQKLRPFDWKRMSLKETLNHFEMPDPGVEVAIF